MQSIVSFRMIDCSMFCPLLKRFVPKSMMLAGPSKNRRSIQLYIKSESMFLFRCNSCMHYADHSRTLISFSHVKDFQPLLTHSRNQLDEYCSSEDNYSDKCIVCEIGHRAQQEMCTGRLSISIGREILGEEPNYK